jgi:excisionase family DNA binding protein
MSINKNLISVKEAADLLGYSRMQIVRLIDSGTIKANRVGRSYVIDRNDISGIFKQITPGEEKAVNKAVNKAIDEYEPLLKKLGKE